jgi:hypothetical protein
MNLQKRIESFAELGKVLRNSLEGNDSRYSCRLLELIQNQHEKNEWFTPEYTRMAVESIATELTYDNLFKWCSAYPSLAEERKPINVGVVMAGNIPLVGFHDFLAVLISGNNIIARTSSKDPDLSVFVAEILTEINKDFKDRISLTGKELSGFDIVIATGSDNSSRYFSYYFGKYPHIIRRNRNSIAILDGTESDSEIEALGVDIFSYFGLGCRNVSKIYLPEGYDPLSLASKWSTFSDIIKHRKYVNNLDFNKAVFIVNREKFIDAGFMLMKENKGLSSPVSVLFYEYYSSPDDLKHQIALLNEKIQCIVSRHDIQFGMAQSPHLWDYADGIDTIDFILKKNIPGIL